MSAFTYELPGNVRPELFGLYQDETASIYIVLEAAPEVKEVSLNKFLALHMNHLGQTPEEFYSKLADCREYIELVKYLRRKANKVGAKLRYAEIIKNN